MGEYIQINHPIYLKIYIPSHAFALFDNSMLSVLPPHFDLSSEYMTCLLLLEVTTTDDKIGGVTRKHKMDPQGYRELRNSHA